MKFEESEVKNMPRRKKVLESLRHSTLPLLVWFVVPVAQATELIYTPINPSFGGSPLNGSVLLNAAQAQNKSKDPEEALTNEKKSALQQFNETLQRAVLNRLAAAATSNVIGEDGKLRAGTTETGDFIISITDLGGGAFRAVTTDKTTGAVTQFEVSP